LFTFFPNVFLSKGQLIIEKMLENCAPMFALGMIYKEQTLAYIYGLVLSFLH